MELSYWNSYNTTYPVQVNAPLVMAVMYFLPYTVDVLIKFQLLGNKKANIQVTSSGTPDSKLPDLTR